jgi:hypothetical protein
MRQVHTKGEQKKLQKSSTNKKNRSELTGSNRFMLVNIEFMMHYGENKNAI